MARADNELPGIDYRFRDPALLQESLTHRSHSNRNNERLEFLGDAVLNVVVAAELFHHRENDDEGSLSRLRSRVVRGETLARVARGLQLGDHLLMGEGELKSGGYLRASVLADTLEAIFGAIYLDAGYETAVKEEGAEHAKRFTVRCRLEDSGFEADAMGTSRRKAEQAAAEAVLAAREAGSP